MWGSSGGDNGGAYAGGKIIIQEMEADSQVVGDLHGGRTVLVQLQEDKLWMVHQ